MEGVYHVHILKVSRCRFICDVNGMLKGQVPNREGLEFGIAGHPASPVLVIELGKACGKLAAASSGSCYNHQRLCYFNVRIGSVALIAYYGIHISGIALCEAVGVGSDSPLIQKVNELFY